VCVSCMSLSQTTSLACLMYVSMSKYLLALADQVLAFTGPREVDAGGIGGVDENKKDVILDNPFG
jgi:hypothetical protein